MAMRTMSTENVICPSMFKIMCLNAIGHGHDGHVKQQDGFLLYVYSSVMIKN